jgi:hypothetical protein
MNEHHPKPGSQGRVGISIERFYRCWIGTWLPCVAGYTPELVKSSSKLSFEILPSSKESFMLRICL